MTEDERLKFEYEQTGENWRYWGQVRFNQLTLFLSAMGALAAATVVADAPATVTGRVPIAALGVVLSVVFMILEERATFYRRAYVYRAVAIEKRLALWQYQSTKTPGPIKSEHVYRVLFAVIVGMWCGYPFAVDYSGRSAIVGVVAALMFLVVAQAFGSSFQDVSGRAVRIAVLRAAGVPETSLLRRLRRAFSRTRRPPGALQQPEKQQKPNDAAQDGAENVTHRQLLTRPSEDIRGAGAEGAANGETNSPRGSESVNGDER